MKAVFAYLDSGCVKDVVAVLRIAGLTSITVVSTHAALWPMTAQARSHLPQLGAPTYADVKLEIVCADAEVETILTTLRKHAGAHYDGTGCAFVVSLDSVVSLHASAVEPIANVEAPTTPIERRTS
jgi:nitrogen regulatory protein PII